MSGGSNQSSVSAYSEETTDSVNEKTDIKTSGGGGGGDAANVKSPQAIIPVTNHKLDSVPKNHAVVIEVVGCRGPICGNK